MLSHNEASSPSRDSRCGLTLGKAALLCATLLQMACSGVAPKSDVEEHSPQALPGGALKEQPLPHTQPDNKSHRRVTVAAVGDIMLGSDYPQYRLADDPMQLLAPVVPVLQRADVSFGNLEGVLLDGGEAKKRCSKPSSCYLFRSPSSYAETLATAGFDLMSLANNHARDFGEVGRDASMQALDRAGIRHSGRYGDVARWQQNGLDMAMVAFAPFAGSHDMLDMEAGRALIGSLASESDILVVSFHGGAEGADRTALPFRSETFHGEDRGDVVAFSRMAVDAGADLVIGHGPHVPRAMELYHDKLIAYSLGNFATYWGINVRGTNGLAPVLLATLDGEGRFVEGQILSLRQQRPLGPQPDSKNKAALLIRELSLADFPQGQLHIDAQGYLSRRPSAAATASLGASP